MGRAEDGFMHVEEEKGGRGGKKRRGEDAEGVRRELQRQMTSSSYQAEC